MNDRRLTTHERTESLAYRIYLQENKPTNLAQAHWLRAEDALRKLDEPSSVSSDGRSASDHLERATLRCSDLPAITGLAMIYRDRPEEGGKFYPDRLPDPRMCLELPATLHLDDSAETFSLIRLQPVNEAGAGFEIAFQE